MQNRRIITRERSLPPKLGVGMNAHWATLEVLDRERRVVKTVEASNVILNQGLDYVVEHDYPNLGRYCAVGTGVDTDDVEDTGLGNETARTNRLPAGESNVIDDQVVDGRFRTTRHFEFTAAEVEGEALTVVGFSPESSAGSNLVTKVLLPEPIEVPEGHSVRVKYAMDLVLSTGTTPFSIPISGLHTLTGIARWLDPVSSRQWGVMTAPRPDLGIFGEHAHVSFFKFTRPPFGGIENLDNYTKATLSGHLALVYDTYTPGSFSRVLKGLTSYIEGPVEVEGFAVTAAGGPSRLLFGMDFQSTPVNKEDGYILKFNDMKVTWGRE